MTTKIFIAPDFYFRNWNEGPGDPTGEMWLCLRPMVQGQIFDGKPELAGDFTAWVNNCASGMNFELAEIPETQTCTNDTDYLPVNLPHDIDLAVHINGTKPGQFQISRSTGCKVKPNSAWSERGPKLPFDELFEPDGAGGEPFSKLFNEHIWTKFPRDPVDKPSAMFAVTQMLHFGRRFVWTDKQVADRWPFAHPELANAAGRNCCGLYWLLGLMIPIGTQARIEEIHGIDSIDVEFAGASNTFSLKLPPMASPPLDISPFFSKIGEKFVRSLKHETKGQTQLDGHTIHLDREAVTYVKPGIRALASAKPGNNIWRLESRAGVTNQDATDRAIATKGGEKARSGFSLCWLAGIAVSPQLPKLGDPSRRPPWLNAALRITPGTCVDARLTPYRRFPMIKATANGASRLQTILRLDLDPAAAEALEDVRKAMWSAAKGDEAFLAHLDLALKASSPKDWKLSILHAGALPWDGDSPVIKVLANPVGGLTVDTDQLRVWEGGAIELFVPCPAKAGGPDIVLAPGNVEGSIALWRAPADSAANVKSFWTGKSVAPGMEITAFKVNDIPEKEVGQVTVNAMALDEFTFAAAESPVRLERIVRVEASATCGKMFDPLGEYEDDLDNFNAAVLLYGDTVIDPGQVRAPQKVMRQQTEPGDSPVQFIPIIESWARDPADERVDFLNRRTEQGPISWEAIRLRIAEIYGLRPPKSYSLALEHTYGDRLPLGDIPLSTRFDWNVELASNVDTNQQQTGGPKPFLTAEYLNAPNVVVLTFDLSVLTPPPFKPPADNEAAGSSSEGARAYSAAVAGWRSLAELAAAEEADLVIQIANYDLAETLSASEAAADLAKGGLSGGLASIVAHRSIDRISLKGTQLLQDVKALLDPGNNMSMPANLELKVNLQGSPLGSQAHVVQLRLAIRRTADRCRPDTLVCLPTSMQPGLFERPFSPGLEQVWFDAGFGRDGKSLPDCAAGLETQFAKASKAWQGRIAAEDGSITPVSRAEDGKSRPQDPARSAMIAALDGSDWFAPEGPGPQDANGYGVNATLLPIGIAPPKPHGGLGRSTQLALQRFAAGMADTIDVAYESWALAEHWEERFADIANLARLSGKDWDGTLPAFAKALLTLVFPQPADDAANAPVQSLVRRIRGTGSSKGDDLLHLNSAIERQLLRNPALLLDAKAFLLTALQFDPAIAGGQAYPPTTLARTQCRHDIRGQLSTSQTAAQATIKEDSITRVATSESLVLVGDAEKRDWRGSFGFLEVLDDARYDNAFEVGEFLADPIERVLDPRTGDPLQTERSRWPTGAIRVPLVSDSGARTVRLASRASVTPPLLLWAGKADDVAMALDAASTAPTSARWSLDKLLKRENPSDAHGNLAFFGLRMPEASSLPYADTDKVFVLYRIEGDEETSELTEALLNDGLFLRISEPADDAIPGKAASVQNAGDHDLENQLTHLLTAARLSREASDAMNELILRKPGSKCLADEIGQMIKPMSISLPGPDWALLRPEKGTLELRPKAGSQLNSAFRELAILQPTAPGPTGATASGPREAYLLCGVRSTVWKARQLELQHGRNMRYDQWPSSGGGSGSAFQPEAVFAPEFWQAAAQATNPGRHPLARTLENSANHWHQSGYNLLLRNDWRGAKSAGDLLTRLLANPSMTIDGLPLGNGILDPKEAASRFSETLHVSVYHEQFVEEPFPAGRQAEPIGRFLTRSPFTFKEASDTVKFFAPEYDHFSIDFAWYSKSGMPMLLLRRIFVHF